jgi:hypothetical protein
MNTSATAPSLWNWKKKTKDNCENKNTLFFSVSGFSYLMHCCFCCCFLSI